MSIKKRLLLSNIGMIVIPFFSFFLVEIILGYFLFVVFNGNPQGTNLKIFISLRFLGIACILVLTNGLLTYFVSKSIITPIKKLSEAAQKISAGQLDFKIELTGKDELGQLANTFEKMRLNLKEAQNVQERYEQNRKALVASISHDLKTPLTSIKGYVKGIQEGVARTPAQLERYLDTIDKKATDMDALIDELFLYSKLDLESVPFQIEEIDLYSFFQDYMEELTFILEKDHGKATLSAQKQEVYHVKADREQLKRAISNIIQNSLKYMDKTHKEINVSLISSEEEVRVEISDNGSGIEKENLPFIFDDFYRTDTSRNSETGGSGLGLAIVKKIIHASGGRIWAESTLGKGTTINLTLKKVKQ